jgi:hypothetical protein
MITGVTTIWYSGTHRESLLGSLEGRTPHVFSAEGINKGVGKSTAKLGHSDRTSSNMLNQYPVEVLAIEETSTSRDEKVNTGQGGLTPARP